MTITIASAVEHHLLLQVHLLPDKLFSSDRSKVLRTIRMAALFDYVRRVKRCTDCLVIMNTRHDRRTRPHPRVDWQRLLSFHTRTLWQTVDNTTLNSQLQKWLHFFHSGDRCTTADPNFRTYINEYVYAISVRMMVELKPKKVLSMDSDGCKRWYSTCHDPPSHYRFIPVSRRYNDFGLRGGRVVLDWRSCYQPFVTFNPWTYWVSSVKSSVLWIEPERWYINRWLITSVTFLISLAVIPCSPACFALIWASLIKLHTLILNSTIIKASSHTFGEKEHNRERAVRS